MTHSQPPSIAFGHHAIIFEMNVEGYRRRGALDRKKRAGAARKLRDPAPS
jgi:hypothetical protein